MIVSFTAAIASAQSNRIVFGPLEGDDAGILTVHNGEDIEIEMWVRTDPENPAPIMGVGHALMSEDEIIAERNSAQLDPDYDMPNWEFVEVDGPYVHDPGSNYPIPAGNTCEIVIAILEVFGPPVGDPLDTQGEWDYYGAFLMTCNTDVPIDNTYYPFSAGWYPHSGEGFRWAFEFPPGGGIEPEQSYGGLHFEGIPCEYIPGDCDHNGTALELSDLIAMIGIYRGMVTPYYTCDCPPHGSDFAPEGDTDGNCMAFELGDVVMEIGAYRGEATPQGCVDCPGSP